MRETGGGSIINTASILAHTGDPFLPIYTATKTGVLGMTRAIAVDYAGDGIRCNCVSPGDMETPMIQKYFDATPDPAATRAEMEATYPGQAVRPSKGGRPGGALPRHGRGLVHQRHLHPRRRRPDRQDLLNGRATDRSAGQDRLRRSQLSRSRDRVESRAADASAAVREMADVADRPRGGDRPAPGLERGRLRG